MWPKGPWQRLRRCPRATSSGYTHFFPNLIPTGAIQAAGGVRSVEEGKIQQCRFARCSGKFIVDVGDVAIRYRQARFRAA